MNLRSTVRLCHEVEMPIWGLGLSHNGGGFSEAAVREHLAMCTDAGATALFDTAARYGTEGPLAACLEGVPRSSVFLTTKMWPDDASDPLAALRRSLNALKVDWVDLWLVHWPGLTANPEKAAVERLRVWRAFCDAHSRGLAKSIGVSNFEARHIEKLCVDCDREGLLRPMVNQIEFSPLQQNYSTVEATRACGAVVVGWSPLAKGAALDEREVRAIADSTGTSPVSVCLRFSLQSDVPVIAKTTQKDRIRTNASGAFDLTLSDSHMRRIAALHRNYRSSWDPSGVV